MNGTEMNHIEAMKQALEALEKSCPAIPRDFPAHGEAITALRAATEEAEKQEPVAYQLRHPNVNFGNWYTVDMDRHRRATKDFERRELVVSGSTPPAAQREGLRGHAKWVGLTQQDIDIAFDDTQEGGGFDEFAHAIEAKLKKKNGGAA